MDESLSLEEALSLLQRRSEQMAAVFDAKGEWTGIVTIEDMVEEIVGRIGDEFDQARADRFNSLADALSPGRVVLVVRAETVTDAIRNIVDQVPRPELPSDPETVSRALQQGGQTVPTYIGKGLLIRHAQLEGLDRPILIFARSDEGVALEGSNERADLIFLLLTPSGMTRTRIWLLADSADLFDSEYVTDRLRKAEVPNGSHTCRPGGCD